MKKLRSGYTTGACAAAAAKGATELLLMERAPDSVNVTFPDGSRVSFQLAACYWLDPHKRIAAASVIKDAGDDPDVTNGAEIVATVSFAGQDEDDLPGVRIYGGAGVGTVTKPGLAVPVGQAAINPVPRKMIEQAVVEAAGQATLKAPGGIKVVISVPEGLELAQKTLNERLGIIGGISILGTTGIVRPISADAWTATITSCMDVAAANGCEEIILSTGRTSESALERLAFFQPEAFVMMGDYLEFALREAGKYPFKRLHMAGMWAKILKAALKIPHTHVRFGVLEMEQAIGCIRLLPSGANIDFLEGCNTAREMYSRLQEHGRSDIIAQVCSAARDYHQEISGLPARVYLVHHTGKIITTAG